jgi:hypothetical protein
MPGPHCPIDRSILQKVLGVFLEEIYGRPLHSTERSERLLGMRLFQIYRHFLAQRRNHGYDVRDEKLDRRKLRDRADEPYGLARCVRILQPVRVPAGGRKISIPIRRNPLKSPDSEK